MKKKAVIVFGAGIAVGWLGIAIWLESQARKQGPRWISLDDKPLFAS